MKGQHHSVRVCPGKKNSVSLTVHSLNIVTRSTLICFIFVCSHSFNAKCAHSLVKYKSVLRKDFFGELPGETCFYFALKSTFHTLFFISICHAGVVGVHGIQWKEFRSRVQKPVLRVSTARRYVKPLEQVTSDFMLRCESLVDENNELPKDFANEIHKWALECIGLVALDTRLGCLDGELAPESEPQQIITAAQFALRNIATLELKAPWWRWFPTPMWKRYVRNMDYFVE